MSEIERGVFTKQRVRSLHGDDLRDLVEAFESRRNDDLEEVAKFVGINDPRAIRTAGAVDIVDEFISEIRTELDRRNAAAREDVNERVA